MKHYPFILILWFSAHAQLWSQDAEVAHLGIEQGLSQGFVTCFEQDREGFIWAGTMNGLNRYDGQRVQVFVNNPNDPLSLSSSAISAVHDFGECLLVGTYGTGLNIFCKRTQQFLHLPYHLPSQPDLPTNMEYTGSSLPAENVFNEIVVDADGQVWLVNYNGVFSKKAWVVRMEVPSGFWEALPSNPSLVAKLRYKAWNMDGLESKWFQYLAGNGQQLYCLKRDEALYFDFSKQNWLPLNHILHGSPPLVSNIIFAADKCSSLMQNPDFSTWLCTGNSCKALGRLPGLVFFFNEKRLWLRRGNWLSAFDIGPSLVNVDWAAPVLNIPIKDARTMAMFDRSGNLWFADDILGLAKYATIQGRFKHYFAGQSLMTKPLQTNGSGYCYIQNSRLRLEGSTQASLLELDRILEQKRIKSYLLNSDAAGNYWLVGFNPIESLSYVLRFDPKLGRAKWWATPKPKAQTFFSVFDEAGMLWFTAGGILGRFDPHLPDTASDQERWAFFDFGALGTASDEVVGMAKTADGSWWMASIKGLIRAKPKLNQAGPGLSFDFHLYGTDANNPNSLRSNNVACVLAAPTDANLLWIGTKGGGLSRLDIRTDSFTHLTTEDGLPNDVIYGIVPDDEGRLWLSSNRGIIRYDPATREIKSFRQADGLQSDEFNSHAYAKAANGELMFGGVNGLNVFDPKDLVENRVMPKVLLTGLEINNVTASVRDKNGILEESIEFCNHIVLPYSKNSITFKFSSLDFTAPAKNKFRYYLKGAEKAWAHEGNVPVANYLNLRPGHYTFIVNGSNNDGIWSNEPASLHVIVLAPWYRTWLAYALYLMVAGLIAYGLVSDWMKKRDLRQALALKEKEARHLKEMNQLKLDEFTHRILEKSLLIAELEGRLNGGNRVGSSPSDQASHAAKPDDLHRLYKSQILTAEDWENFKGLFDRVHPGFLPQLMHHYPQLTPAESRLVMLTKMGLNTAEIATMIGVSAETVKKTRQRLRKKLEANQVSLEDLLALP